MLNILIKCVCTCYMFIICILQRKKNNVKQHAFGCFVAWNAASALLFTILICVMLTHGFLKVDLAVFSCSHSDLQRTRFKCFNISSYHICTYYWQFEIQSSCLFDECMYKWLVVPHFAYLSAKFYSGPSMVFLSIDFNLKSPADAKYGWLTVPA